MATRYALLEFTDSEGTTHQPGDKLDAPRNSDQEKVDDQRLLDGGVYAKTQPAGTSARAEARGEQETS